LKILSWARKFAGDPALRQWLYRRALGRTVPMPAFTAGRPPYVTDPLPLPLEQPAPLAARTAVHERPAAPLRIHMHGQVITVDPADPAALFTDPRDDIETHLAMHRFAWLPLMHPAPDANWIWHLWTAWCDRAGQPQDGWAWHPYTATERAINILDYLARTGEAAPAGIAHQLAAHAPAISARLEYFGGHNTSNHLANNGRGLYRIGAALGLPEATRLGRDILSVEAERIFGPDGMLREGSSHYHLLYLRNYLDVCLAAHRHGHQADARLFQDIAARAFAAARVLLLPGGMPLIGDISPDCPPAYLSGLAAGDVDCGWSRALGDDEKSRIARLHATTDLPATAAADGWLRYQGDDWAGLWHVPADGWPTAPGHGHQDMGSAELHYRGTALFVDPGRGTYGESAAAALFSNAAVHGTLTVDGINPYPTNKPYYDDGFRRRMAPGAHIAADGDTVTLRHGGYRRLGITETQRAWSFSSGGFRLRDRLTGHGKHRIVRAFVTPFPTTLNAGSAVINTPDSRFILRSADAATKCTMQATTIWHAYGEGRPGTRISFETRTEADWQGVIDCEAVS
jgi:hypothetical protein